MRPPRCEHASGVLSHSCRLRALATRPANDRCTPAHSRLSALGGRQHFSLAGRPRPADSGLARTHTLDVPSAALTRPRSGFLSAAEPPRPRRRAQTPASSLTCSTIDDWQQSRPVRGRWRQGLAQRLLRATRAGAASSRFSILVPRCSVRGFWFLLLAAARAEAEEERAGPLLVW
ncbi:hypothetical protein CERSUDRAFT_101182 [Gelatoporia subvermispora B]|uniref:Uncharacterized protein n=1 Tax=Ceriporiopsis subvermispora (strain B) TaxID=914234 RepID=M2QXD7_CERS8|nr:hypothetical protein CERSUDRAFT_101182 [Gelatoporia subvermispora B]